MLRKAPGENLDDRKYIVTVPGRGYRLAESVHLVPNQEFTFAAVKHSRIHVEERRLGRWISIGLVLLVAAGSVMLWLHRQPVIDKLVRLRQESEVRHETQSMSSRGHYRFPARYISGDGDAGPMGRVFRPGIEYLGHPGSCAQSDAAFHHASGRTNRLWRVGFFGVS